MSKTINIGKVSLTPKGEWEATNSYESLDVVRHSKKTWIAIKNCKGEEPTENSEYWFLVLDGASSDENNEDLLVFLPDEIYASPGRTMEVYNKNVCPMCDGLRLVWECDIGEIYEDKFSVEVKSALVGTHSLTLKIYNQRLELIFEKTAALIVSAPAIINQDTAIYTIGDELCDGEMWLKEVSDLSGSKLHFRGSRGLNSEYGSGEFRSGWSAKIFTHYASYDEKGTSVENPFWDGTKFDWTKYLPSLPEYECVFQILLGRNDLIDGTPEEYIENMKTIISSMRGAYPNVDIAVVLPPCWTTQNGVGRESKSDSALKGKISDLLNYNLIKGVKMLYDVLKSENIAKLHFIPFTSCFDSKYNFGIVSKEVNSYNSDKLIISDKARKFSYGGNMQAADILFAGYSVAMRDLIYR